ncbi:MAG: murein transglycosylase A [Sphingosinicella sp.]
MVRAIPLQILIALSMLLAGCVHAPSPQSQTSPATPAAAGPAPQPLPIPEPPPPLANAIAAGILAGPSLTNLELGRDAADRALRAFLISCPDLLRRADGSGLTQPQDWRAACASAAGWPAAGGGGFFRTFFDAVQVGDGRAFATGYYEPEIMGSRPRRPGYEVPVYAKPPDLLDADPATGERRRGRLDAAGRFVPYFERGDIEDGALAGRGLEIAWAADGIEFFFLQIQGSGRLRLPDGSVMRIGYAGQNGREYVAIGRLLRERGLLTSPVTMQAVVAWLRANPSAGRALMRENKSYIFFRELTGPGPLGSLGRPVTPRASVAADPLFVPLGAPVLLVEMDNARADGLWVAQDTGGAIRGPNRFDTFWGAGAEAATIAGGMSARGRAWLLLPRAIIARHATPTQP